MTDIITFIDEGLNYIWNIQDYTETIKNNLSSFSSNIDKKLTDINNNISIFLSNFNGYATTIKSNLTTIISSLQNIEHFLNQLRDYIKDLRDLYYPDPQTAGDREFKFDIKVGWHNFWKSFRYKTFDEVLLDVHKKIEDEVNPLSDNNKDDFNSNIEQLKSQTAYGSALELKDGVQNLYNNISGASPTSSLNVNLLPVNFFGSSIPAKTIKIDFSWYAPYRDTALSIWRFFLWVFYIFIVFKRFPDIISGAGLVTDLSNSGNFSNDEHN